jgi:signal transduction histidine kinase
VDLSQVRVGSFHVLLDQHAFPPPKGYFLSGLLVLGLVIALAMIPVSRLMTRRLKQLRQSAIRISEGDLSHRARIRGSDEVAELAGAFNGMTDKLEGMIVSGKELVANVSHELRSPLTRIRLAEEMLREKLVQAGAEGCTGNLDAIREEVDELDTLIGRILELSKLNLRESPLRFEPMDPSDLIRGLLERLRPAMDRKGLRLEARLTYDPPFMGDLETLRSALINVLENAVRFTPEKGDISVRMEWMRESLGISVVNTFDRLSEGDLALLFHPFQRRKGSAAPSGYGLGLTIARRAIERHGGSVEARNAEKGFEISISLPRRPAA